MQIGTKRVQKWNRKTHIITRFTISKFGKSHYSPYPHNISILKWFKEGPIWTKFDSHSKTCNSKNENPLGNNPNNGVDIHFLAFSHICENVLDLVTLSQLTFLTCPNFGHKPKVKVMTIWHVHTPQPPPLDYWWSWVTHDMKRHWTNT
jgi:hypothetical protein